MFNAGNYPQSTLAACATSKKDVGPGGEVTRRAFLAKASAGLVGVLLAPSVLTSCATTAHAHIKGQLHSPNHALGHLLRWPEKLPAPTQTLRTDVLIVGGGVAGLSARRWLHRQGRREVLLLELEAETGGNAAAGHNAVAAYPWGAHYLPVPDPRNHELLEFLEETGTITSYDPTSGLPIYNEYHLCHDPEERLSINGHWQTGLVPEMGVPAADRQQIAHFFALVEEMKQARGEDGRGAFRIPLPESSADAAFRLLDQLSFADYLAQQGFTSPYLRWYLDYCCQDDYGAPAARVSAWAGLHYFAARKGKGHNATASDVLTWPEGNGFLVKHLRQAAPTPVRPHTLAYALHETPTGVAVLAYDAATKQALRIEARQVLLATPQFVTQRLLGPLAATRPPLPLHHAPWLVANLTVTGLPQGPGAPLSWDNVRYGSPAGGYIDATHQHLSLADNGPKVITFYWPLTDEDPAAARRRAYQTTYAEWLPRILAELEIMHPGITPLVQAAEVRVWGHGMVAPTPGLLWGAARAAAARPIHQKIFFAHTDLSGISIFEEGFYQGVRAAREMLYAV